jgi:hypothetical protein
VAERRASPEVIARETLAVYQTVLQQQQSPD